MNRTWRTRLVFVGSIIAIVVLALVYCGNAKAAEPKVQFFLPLSARYINDWGVSGGVAVQDLKTKMIFMAQISYDQFNGSSGFTSYTVGCRQYSVPYTVPSSGHRGVEFTVAIPLGKK